MKQLTSVFVWNVSETVLTSCMLNEKKKKEKVFAYISLSFHPLQCNLMALFNIQKTHPTKLLGNQTGTEFYEASLFMC